VGKALENRNKEIQPAMDGAGKHAFNALNASAEISMTVMYMYGQYSRNEAAHR